MDHKNYGVVYLLSNPAMPGLVKIGMTTQKDVDTRMKELYQTGVPVPFECEYACKVETSQCPKIEKALHTAFAPNRINPNREFFRIIPEQAKAMLEIFDKGDVTEEVTKEIDDDLTPEDKAASEKIKSSNRPALNYLEMGISEGSKLKFVNNPSIKVTVVDGKHVRYKGRKLSLTVVTQELLNVDRPIRPTGYWSYEGKNLRDIYDDTYPIEV